jgi:hypothetical protein
MWENDCGVELAADCVGAERDEYIRFPEGKKAP